jgi:hypothetical protein
VRVPPTSRRRSRGARPAEPPADLADAAGGADGEKILLAVLAGCLALRAAASLSASSWLWGLNTLRDWPAPWPVLLPALAALAFVPALARAARGPLERLGDLMADSRWKAPLLLTTLAMTAFFLLSDPVRFTGDSGTRISWIPTGAPMPLAFPQISVLDLMVNVDAVRRLMGLGLPGPMAMQAAAALLGAAFTLAVLAFLRYAGARGAAWLAAAAVILGSGSLVHFPGYAKYGPLLVGLALAAAGLVRLAREGRGAWTLAIGLVLALLGHRSAYAVLPGAAWAFLAAWRLAPRAERARIAGAGAAVALVALILLPHTIEVLLGFDLAVNVIGSATLGHVDPARQLANGLDVLFFLSPLWPVGLAAAWLALRGAAARDARVREEPATTARRGEVAGRPVLPFVGAAALAVFGELAVTLASRPKQGPMRDWDVGLGTALLVTLAMAQALIVAGRRARLGRTALPVLATALLGCVALWGIQFAPGISERRVASLLADPTGWSGEEWARAHEYLGQRALAARRYDEAARNYGIAVEFAPSPRMMDNLAVSLGRAGRREEAATVLRRAMAMPQGTVEMWMALSHAAWELGDTARAVICSDSALVRDPYRPDARAMHERFGSGGAGP